MSASTEKRILVLAPTRRDAALTSEMLAAHGIERLVCDDVQGLVAEMESGVGAILLAEEVVTAGHGAELEAAIANQPPWSDVPVLLITGQRVDSPAVVRALRSLRNVTLIERPIRIIALVSIVRSALRARERQYLARDLLAEREQTADVLRHADRRKDEFLAMLAHELRNPLAPIRNSLQILRMTARFDADAESVCEMMERQVNHMVRLVDDLMEVSRITRDLIELRREELDLSGVLRGALETSKPLIEAKHHQLAISLPAERVVLEGDSVRLGQVFSNLLNNAAKYTEPHGQIWLAATLGDQTVTVTIRDNGIGLSSETLPVVFDMFMQVDRSSNRTEGGLGIGLTLVKKLVELHGGTISARSDGPGRGTEFSVELPIVAAQATEAKPVGTRQAAPKIAKRKVLVVDDNQDAATSLGMLLRCLGTEVQVVNDGESALGVVPSFRPDIILLDIGMPGMDGFEVAARIRSQAENSHIELIALTGWGNAEDRERTREAGFNHHLVKPADLGALQSLLAVAK